MHILSKSSYMRGRQCPKALYLVKNRRDLMTPISPAQQAILDQGTKVGELACTRFFGGLDCSTADHHDYSAALEKTRQALLDHDVIYEAAFMHEGVLAVLDILVRDGAGWRAIEAKSSTSVKPQFVVDAALQYHVITGAGVPLTGISIMHLDNGYVRQGLIDVQKLFHLEDVTAMVMEKQEEVRRTIQDLKQMLDRKEEPLRDIGPHCESPYSCDFKSYCWKEIPVPSVLDLARGRKLGYELFGRGIVRLEDIPPDIELTEKQFRQVTVQRSGVPIVEPLPIHAFLDQLEYPIHCLDFETFSCAVPPFDGTRPYQQIPFQYSIHVIYGPGMEPQHHEFLADGRGDPREEMVLSLLTAIGPTGSILAYNLTFENTVLAQLAVQFPKHARAINGIITRCKDLAIPFANQWYYDRGMNGRYSIKQVLPALVPELSYEGMPVHDGMTASAMFARYINGHAADDPEQWRRDMLAYCKMDTLAMVKLLQVLEKV